MSEFIKKCLVRSVFHKPLLDLVKFITEKKIQHFSGASAATRNYCISPYKTGTTYIAGLFSEGCDSQHEPLHYTTLCHLEDTGFLEKRARYLNLDLESSGFFADRLQQLRLFAPEAPVLFLSRHPEKWIESLINYFSQLNNRVNYNYVVDLYLNNICQYPVDRFFDLIKSEQQIIVSRLLEYYISVYSAALLDPNVLVIDLNEVDSRLPEIEAFFTLKATKNNNIWRRESEQKQTIRLADYVNLDDYSDAVIKIGYVLT